MKSLVYNFKLIGLSCMAVLITMSSCKKEEIIDDIVQEENPPAPAPPFPVLQASDGTLVAVKNQSTQSSPIGDMTISIGLGVAAFYETGNMDSFIEAGNVSLNSSACTKQANNAYVFQPSAQSPTGIDFGSGVSWSVSGSANVNAFSFDPSISFPSIAQISSGSTVSKTNGYTLTTTSVSSADSVIFQIGDVIKTLSGTATSCSFSAADLSGLATGMNVVQIAAYKIQNQSITGKNYYFVNETVVSKTVTIE